MNSKAVHVIYLTGSGGHNFTITDAEPSDYLGKPSIKGKSITSKKPHWIEGTTVYVPLDRVDVIVVYDNEEAFHAAMKLITPPPPNT
jgi:hypothetical protein